MIYFASRIGRADAQWCKHDVGLCVADLRATLDGVRRIRNGVFRH